MFRLIAFLMVVFLAGCEQRDVKVIPVNDASIGSTRFEAVIVGRMNVGYKDNPRDIIILTDKLTEKKYLAITGCGVTELVEYRSGKSTTIVEE